MAATIITNITELQNMKNNLSGEYELGNNIDASDTINWNSGQGFKSIGQEFPSAWFTGTFDGKGYTISGLYMNYPYWGHVGLFGQVSWSSDLDGYIKNVNISNIQVRGSVSVGGLIGYLTVKNYEDSDIVFLENCSVNGKIYGNRSVGGIVGSFLPYVNDNIGRICVNSCHFSGDLETPGVISENVGGFGGLVGSVTPSA